MKKNLAVGLVTGLLLFGIVGFANATLISGDFRTEGDLPYYGTLGPKVYQNLGAAIDGGVELTGADFKDNPSGWLGGLVYMDLNPTTNILTLAPQDTGDFQTFDVWINNIVFDGPGAITGISMISNELLISPPVFAPTFSFTPNSIHIRWDCAPPEDSPSDHFHFNGPAGGDTVGGIAEFQIATFHTPVPGAVWLLGSGLIGLMGLIRRKM